RAAMWHYQWVVLHDFLPRAVGDELVAELLQSGPRYFHVRGGVFIPLEFADAAYRYGHSQVRHHYQVNDQLGPVPLFPDLVVCRAGAPARPGACPLFSHLAGDPPPQGARRPAAPRPQPLVALPYQIAGAAPGTDYASLAIRDLQRGQGMSLPSGEAVAPPPGGQGLPRSQGGPPQLGWGVRAPPWPYNPRGGGGPRAGRPLPPAGGPR